MKKPAFASLLALITGLSFWTLAPYGGCSCNNPLGPTGGPTPTLTPTHGPVVDTFEGGSNDAATRINNWNGVSEKSVDSFNVSKYFSQLTVDGTGVGGSGRDLNFYGTFGKAVAAGGCGTSPYVAHRIYLSARGAGGDEDVTISVPGGATGVRFYLKSTMPGNPLVVKLILKSLSDYAGANPCNHDAYAYHTSAVNMAGTSSWIQKSLPFTSFKQPTWCSGSHCDSAAISLADSSHYDGNGDLRIMAIQFEPTNNSSGPGSADFNFDIDNLEFY